MAESKWPITQLSADQFVNSAGSVLFVPPTSGKPLRVCLLYHVDKDEYLLPKGRQDLGESLLQAAMRETFEETGFACEVLPVDMDTRSPVPGSNTKDVPHFVRGCTEPFTVSLRHVSSTNIKFIWWFLSRTPESGAVWTDGTQTPNENFKSALFEVDVDVGDEAALEAATAGPTYANDRDILKMALRLVAKTYPQWFTKRARTGVHTMES